MCTHNILKQHWQRLVEERGRAVPDVGEVTSIRASIRIPLCAQVPSYGVSITRHCWSRASSNRLEKVYYACTYMYMYMCTWSFRIIVTAFKH